MATAEIKEVIEELTNGSTEAVASLTLIAQKPGCTFSQFQLISSAVYGVLDATHLQQAKKISTHKDTSTYPLQQAMCSAVWHLSSQTGFLVRHMQPKHSAVYRPAGLHFMIGSYQESIDIGFRIVAKRCIVDFLGLCRSDTLGEAFNAVVTSPGIIATLFALWHLETQDRRFSPCLDDELPPSIFNTPAILDSWMCTFAHQERWNWPEILRPFNGQGAVIATTALDHLQHDVAQTSINYDRVIWDIHLMTTLSINDAIRIPFLNQRSMAIVAGVMTLMVKQSPVNKQRPLVAKCISYACWYIRAYLEATDGLPWVAQVVEAVIEGDRRRLPYLPDSRPTEQLFKAWGMFEKVVRNRAGLLGWDEGNETHIESCQNAQVGPYILRADILNIYTRSPSSALSRDPPGHSNVARGASMSTTAVENVKRTIGRMEAIRSTAETFKLVVRGHRSRPRFFSDRINEVATADNVNPVVVELDYTDIPMKIGVGSVHSMPSPETCQCDASMHQKWDHMVELAQKSSKSRILVRAFIPGGTSPKVKLQVLPLKRILPDYDPAKDEDPVSEFDDTFDHLYSCAGLSFGIIDDTFPDEAMRRLREKTGALTVVDKGLDALD
ncbi:hypothetical protein BU15DRAFT_61095 [Melanogaster broomeanus]|nr:hypothetical protein BU15DRAFT_61095 [Melanogaster broomeanus]